MDVIVSIDQRYDSTPDGAVWSPTNSAYPFWLRYLEVFDNVRVMARVRPVSSVPSNWQRVDGEKVSVVPIPYYVGPVQYFLKALQVQQAVSKGANLNDAIILRVPSNVANCIDSFLSHTNQPYGLEVVGDPYNFFSPGSVKHPLRPFFRKWFTHRLKNQCLQASAVSYVTKKALQQRYPGSAEAYLTYYSDVELSDEAFISTPWLPHPKSDKITLITVGALEHPSKAVDVLIDAVAICIQEGLNLELIVVGDGIYRVELEAQAIKLGIKERVFFRGQLPAGKAVFEQLDTADLFVLPSRQESMPRALIEAMARGLACIGSIVGGIPELLSPEELVLPGDVAALAAKIKEVVTEPERMMHMSVCNLETAKEYKDRFLQERRFQFYNYLKETTETWLKINV